MHCWHNVEEKPHEPFSGDGIPFESDPPVMRTKKCCYCHQKHTFRIFRRRCVHMADQPKNYPMMSSWTTVEYPPLPTSPCILHTKKEVS